MKKNLGSTSIGFRVKTGWASVVLLHGCDKTAEVIDAQRIELCDPAIPDCKQPWHAAEGMTEAEGSRIVERLRKLVVEFGGESVKKVLQNYRNQGHRIVAAGLTVGSLIDPTAIKNPHIRAHALEGRLFRTVIQETLELHRIPSCMLVEREAYSKAAGILKRNEDDVKRAVAGLRRGYPKGPWRSDQKMAALAAWVAWKERRG
jgi:hypothetical protein